MLDVFVIQGINATSLTQEGFPAEPEILGAVCQGKNSLDKRSLLTLEIQIKQI